MADLQRASSRWQHNERKAVAAGRPTHRDLAAPVHAVEAGETVALCGAKAPVTGGEPWRKASGVCPRCADLAKKASA